MPEITLADGLSLHYLLEGAEGEPVLFINGAGDAMETWDPQVRAVLEAGYRSLTFDPRGAGKSRAAADTDYSIAGFAKDANELLDQLDISPVHVVGTSMGGCVAQELAIRYPSSVRTLVLSDTWAGPHGWVTEVLDLMYKKSEDLDPHTMIRDLLLFNLSPRYYEMHAAEVPGIVDEYVATINADVFHGHIKACQAHDAVARLAEISKPTLIIAAEQDIVIPVAVQRAQLHDGIPHSKFVVIPGAHLCAVEEAPAYNEALLEFLHSHRVAPSAV